MQLPFNEISQVLAPGNQVYADDRTVIKRLLTDSRDLAFPSETLFFALRTAGNDGHKYIAELYERGVRHFVTDRDLPEGLSLPDARIVRTDDVLNALQRLGAYVRTLVNDVTIVAVTGSRGKTTVKEQIQYLLQGSGIKLARSPRSYNSQIGVPLSMWEISPDDDAAIIEAGVSRQGEMTHLRDIIHPDWGVFTSLTDEHSEGFASTDTKVAEKAGLFVGCTDIFVATGSCPEHVCEIIAKTCPDARLRRVEGGNKELALAIAGFLAGHIQPDANEASVTERYQSIPTTVSPRISVSETLKSCLVAYDGFTFDSRSVEDSVNFASRLVTPGKSLTVIMPSLPDDNEEIMAYLEARGVKRLITVQTSVKGYKGNIKTEFRDYTDPMHTPYTISDFSNEVILVKGHRSAIMEEIRSTLEAPRHETVLEVDLGAITRNFNYFRSKLRPSTGVVAMVKAEGYGIGALELSKTLQSQGASYLAVAVIDEGVALRRGGIDMPIIVMNPVSTNYNALFENRIEPSVFSLPELRLLLDNAERLGYRDYPVHIKLDTGMHRLGFTKEMLPQLIETLKHQNALKVASVFSHLATADCLDQDEYTLGQLRAYDMMSNTLLEALPYRVKRHVLNTAGILRYPEYQYDMVRLGIGLYGVAPVDGYHLDTVATLVTTIISIKDWEPGITIGYGRKGIIDRPSRIATIPIGYADGMNRHLSNHAAWVMVNGVKCDIIGNICMDQCMIDVTDADAKVGDPVEIFGLNAPIQRLSDTLETIPYEILTSVSPRVKRICYRE